MVESEYQNDGFNNEQILQFIESNDFNLNSEIVYQAGDGGPVVTYDVAEEIVEDDSFYGEDTIVLFSGDVPYIDPKTNKTTLKEFMQNLEENISKQVVLVGNGIPVRQMFKCENFKELKKYIQKREFDSNAAPEIKKAKLHYPVLVLDDCI